MKKQGKQNTAKKKNTVNKQSTAKMAKIRHLNHVKENLIKFGVPEEEIKDILEKRIVTCMSYGQHAVVLGDKVIKRKNGTEVTVKDILRGTDAIQHTLEENGFTVLCKYRHFISVKVGIEDLEKVTNLLGNFGRIKISVWKAEPSAKEEKVKKEKKPTNNTTEKKVAAKKARKSANKKNAEMRTYYAALRNGGVSKRIKKYNKTLAQKIEAWLKEQKKKNDEKTAKSKEYRKKHRQLTTAERKEAKKAQKVAQKATKLKAIQASEKKRFENNKAKQEKARQKAKKGTQTELKLAA